MLQHFLCRVLKEHWFLLLKDVCHRADSKDICIRFKRGRVHIAIESEHLQMLLVIAQDVEIRTMQSARAGQNPAQALQDRFDGGVISDCSRVIQQRLVSAIYRHFPHHFDLPVNAQQRPNATLGTFVNRWSSPFS